MPVNDGHQLQTGGSGAEVDLSLNGTITSNQVATQSITLNGNPTIIQGNVTLAIDPDATGISEGDYDVSHITYDANGNIQSLRRNGQGALDDLSYSYDPNKPNQLRQVEDAVASGANGDDIDTQTDANNYVYNEIGQLIENKAEQIQYFYNASGLVTEVWYEGSPKVKFMYNDRNHRAKKESYHNGSLLNSTFYVRDVAGQVMAIYTEDGSQPQLVEQPIYGAGRIGVQYTNGFAVYELTDHLGNVRALFTKESATDGDLEGYTDYYPFGMPMPQRQMTDANQYRYAYQGQEKDPETGKEAFQLRLWDSRIGRWLSPDPYTQFASPYLGMGNNPISGVDFDGGKVYIYKKGIGFFEYKNGNIYDKNGDVYSGNDSFLLETRDALRELDFASSTVILDEGGNLKRIGIINDIVKSDDIYRINYEKGAHATRGQIYIDPKATVSTPTTDGVTKSPYSITLVHEIGHLFSKNNGFYNADRWATLEGKKIKFDENFASNFENIFRDKLDLPLRTHYGILGGKGFDPTKLFWPIQFGNRVANPITRGIVEVGQGTFGAPILD